MLELPDNQEVIVKLECNGYRVPTTLKRVGGRIEYIKSPFGLKDEIKAMKGSRWHGFEDPPRKIWSTSYCFRNLFQLEWLAGGNPYAPWERGISELEYTRPLRQHQKEMTDMAMAYHYVILAAEMGCCGGDAEVHVNRAGKGFKMKLKDLHRKLQGAKDRGHSWDLSIPTYVRSLKGEILGLNRVIKSLDKGVKETVKVTLASGKSVQVTPDHKICVGYNDYTPAEQLSPGDTVLSNGTWVDKDGYVRVGGLKGKHPRWTTGGVYEHILVMEKMIGRHLNDNERVHHKNRVKHDNREENLELVGSPSEHGSLHASEDSVVTPLNGGASSNGGEVWFVPVFDTVVSVESCGTNHVYDLVMDDPYRNFVADGVVIHNCGKTLSAIEILEKAIPQGAIWVAPKSGLNAVEREFNKWAAKTIPNFYTYEGFTRACQDWTGPIPQLLLCDESSRLKNASSKRAQAAQWMADQIRETWGPNGYVILMSGSPSPKTPVDWWAQCEIAAPGFLREGSMKAEEHRLGVFEDKEVPQGIVPVRTTWLDDERKCAVCGKYDPKLSEKDLPPGAEFCEQDGHKYKPSVNEVALLNERLEGLVKIVRKDDCLDLPNKMYERIELTPSSSILRVAEVITKSAPSAIQALTLLRELSDGFQYREINSGKTKCKNCKGEGKVTHWYDPADADRPLTNVDFQTGDLESMETTCPTCGGSGEVVKKSRVAKAIACPKEDALVDLLDQNEEIGRVVVFAGFTGSIDRIKGICLKYGWDVVKVDGRGWEVFTADGKVREKPLDYWADPSNQKVAFVAHPQSGGMGLTLTEARMAIYYSNDFNPEGRTQSEDRVHRMGQEHIVKIVDLIHLPTDTKVLDTLKDNRKLEKMTLGELQEVFKNV